MGFWEQVEGGLRNPAFNPAGYVNGQIGQKAGGLVGHDQLGRDIGNPAAWAAGTQASPNNGGGSSGIGPSPYLNPDGTLKSAYATTSNPLTGQFDERLNGVNMDRRAYDQYSREALRAPGAAAPWLGMMNDRNRLQVGQERDLATADAAGAQSAARSALARQGGISSGARNSLARSGMQDAMRRRQDVARQGMLNQSQYGIQDETNRINMLGNANTMANQNYANDLGKVNAWGEMMKFDEAGRLTAQTSNSGNAMKMYGAQLNAQALAQRADEDKGKFLGIF